MALADGDSLSFFEGVLGYALFGFFLTPLLVAFAVWRSRRTTKQDGTPSTAWATATLVVVRVYAGYLIFVTAMVAIGQTSSRSIDNRVTVEYGWFDAFDHEQPRQRLTISALTKQPLKLCPDSGRLRPVPGEDAEYVAETNCWTKRNLHRDLPGVEVGDWTMEKHVVNPSPAVGQTIALLNWASLAAFGIVLFALERILRETAARRPFAATNVRWLRVLALGVAAFGIVVPFAKDRYADALTKEHFSAVANRVFVEPTAPFGVEPFLVVVLILIFAEVWRFGIRLQRDAEATV